MVSLKIEVGKRDITWMVFGVAILIISFGYAYSNTEGVPSVMGHSLNEIDLPNCSNGQFLEKTVSGWGCSDNSEVFSMSCNWNGWAGVGAQNGARHVNACGSSYMGFIDLYCSSGKVTKTRLYKSTSCE